MVKVVGFDLDNTLYDQRLFEYKAFEHISLIVSDEFHIDSRQYFDELKKLFLSNRREKIFDQAFRNLNSDKLPHNWEKFVKLKILPFYRSFKPQNLHIDKKCMSILYRIKNDCKLVLITNGNSFVQRNKLDLLQIGDIFDYILISDDFKPKRRKPDLFMFKKVLDHFNILPSEMIFIGDDLVNDRACEKLGIKFIHFEYIHKECSLIENIVLKGKQ